MTIRFPQLVVGAVVLVVALGLVRSCAGEARQVRKSLETLGDLIARQAGETQLAAADKTRRLAGRFTDDFVIRLEPFQTTLADAPSLNRAFFSYRAGYDEIGVAWKDVEIQVAPDGRLAEVATVAVLTGRRQGSPSRESFRLTLSLRKQDGNWKIHEAVLVEVVEGLDDLL